MAQLNHLVGACSNSLLFYSSRSQLLSPPSFSLSRAPCKLSLVRCSSSAPSDENKKPSIGFLGLGIMGTAMATNLIKAGYNVSVWNRNASKCEPLINQGARCGSSPADIASQCNITFAMLADPAAALEVASGEHGVIHGLGPGKGYVDISTVDGGTSKTINGLVKATGASFLEAPVSGSKKPAENGTLIFLTAGDEDLYEQAGPLLDVMGKSRFYLGEVGNGAAMKLIVNMVMGSMMASFSEGLVLGDKIGLDPSTIIEVISQGAISSPMFTMKGPSMVKSKFPPAFPLKHQQKDLRLALQLAESVSQPVPVAASANEMYKVAKSKGLGDQDFSAVIEAIKSD
ncbi:hypothetical protein GOP47_0013418 [Adiantum capillus-veneris]|uniref:Uncharacterized protein n=1 Tax=Adiantum capillus-veneris TaxID=13818 RepID=A0A9D4ZEI5_ADICA|nr:hypothetical protein GOP47_0013418 [Adiantum capillus-veneris]